MPTRSQCESVDITDFWPTTTVFCTLIIVFVTFILEFAVHGTCSCCNTIKDDPDIPFDTNADATSQEALLPTVVTEQPQSQPTPEVDTSQPSTVDLDVERAKKKSEAEDCSSNPSPNVRANRFIAAVFLYAVFLTAFIIRIHEIPYIRPECRLIADPNWWALTLLNILPFVAASFSLMRTVVDCLLVRCGQRLSYNVQTGDDAWRTWPPCMPFFLVFVGLYILVKALCSWPIALLMGRPWSSLWWAASAESGRRENFEMQTEETRGLIDDVDGEGDDGRERADGPPAYDEAVHQMQDGAGRRKEGADSA